MERLQECTRGVIKNERQETILVGQNKEIIYSIFQGRHET